MTLVIQHITHQLEEKLDKSAVESSERKESWDENVANVEDQEKDINSESGKNII